MKTNLASTPLDRVTTDLLVIGVYASRQRSPLYRQLKKLLGGSLERVLGGERFRFKAGDSAHFHGLGKLRARQVLIEVLGKRGRLGPEQLRRLAGRGARRARRGRLARIAIAVDPAYDSQRGGLTPAEAQAITEGLSLGNYRFDRYRDRKDQEPFEIAQLRLLVRGRKGRAALQAALDRGLITAAATELARDLVNEPPNVANPPYFRDLAERLAADEGLSLEVLERGELQRREMGCLLAVGEGSTHPTYLIHLTYRPAGKARSRVALVGKCLTFDSGGLCLKTAKGMVDMKVDMAGAAAVIGAIVGAARLKLPVEVHAIFAAAENMTGSAAYRTGDVLTASNGKTVEVINTDAEGRLTLADALVYAQQQEPDWIVDVATLTGACVVALGKRITGVFTPSDRLARQLEKLGEDSGETMWRLPLPEDYRDQIKGTISDLKNVGDRWGGAITAGLFLQEFVERPRTWVHLDIAGPATVDKSRGYEIEGATGTPTRTLIELLAEL